jgi:hypothetical protein
VSKGALVPSVAGHSGGRAMGETSQGWEKVEVWTGDFQQRGELGILVSTQPVELPTPQASAETCYTEQELRALDPRVVQQEGWDGVREERGLSNQ